MQLIIAEKPSVAQAIAKVLNINERKDGYLQSGQYIISWCVGHLVGLSSAYSYDEKYAKWRLEDLPILPDDWLYSISDGKKKQLDILSKLMADKCMTTIINACDAGREGELIFRLVYNFAKCTKPIERLWISSMEETAIKEGFGNLKPGEDYENLYQSALCRSQADWLVGINATRLFSVLYNSTLNVGRVQTPTLALIVGRKIAIESFVKEAFYTILLDCEDFTLHSEKISDIKLAKKLQEKCVGKTATITSVEKQKKSIFPPKLFDLTTLQREANRLFGFTAQQTLDYAQSLYEKKLITYPRTDSRFLTADMAGGMPMLVSMLAKKLSFIASDICLPANTAQVIDNSKVSDHHAIIPTVTLENTDIVSLPAGEKNLLDMLMIRLIAGVADKQIVAETKVTANCESTVFTAKGKTIIQDGWKTIEQVFLDALKCKSDHDSSKNIMLPELVEGQEFKVAPSVKEGATSPPKHFTEDTLLSAMENASDVDMSENIDSKGLGTPATRAGVIEKLVKSKFVERKKKQLVATEKGANLIAILPENIKSPILTAEWEHQLKQIELGEASSVDFLVGIKDMTQELVLANQVPQEDFKSLFATPKGNSVGVCPRCSGVVHEGKKGFFCEQNCGFILWKDNKFFSNKKKTLTSEIATVLLKDGYIHMKKLYSEKTGKSYDATIILDDTGGKYVNFNLEFEKRG